MNKLQINPDLFACNIAIDELMTYIAIYGYRKKVSEFLVNTNCLIVFLAPHRKSYYITIEIYCDICQKFRGLDLLIVTESKR